MKILITGANGFVGSHLTEELLRKNHTIYALVRNRNKLMIDLPAEVKNNLHIVEANFDELYKSWPKDLPTDLDACVHTAGIVHSYDVSEFYRINAYASQKLAKVLYEKNATIHFILISSLAASGPSIGESPRDENEVPLPVSDYGRSKKLAEELVMRITGLSTTIIRPPMVIGPRDLAVLDIFKMVKSRIIILPGMNSKEKKYSFVNVFDLVETINLILNQKQTGLFFSAYPKTITFEDMIEKIKKLFNYKIIFYIPLPLYLVKVLAKLLAFADKFIDHGTRLTPDKYYELAASNFTCSSKKSEVALGQTYKYNIDQTLEMTFKDYKSKNFI